MQIRREFLGGTLADFERELMQDPNYRLGVQLSLMADNVSRMITEMREAAGMSQQDLATMLKENLSDIENLENPEADPKPNFFTLGRIAKVLGYDSLTLTLRSASRPVGDHLKERSLTCEF
jgi:ribosome-binding protein aMBF1 (putative translation factor)